MTPLTCANPKCRHPLDDHDGKYGVCWGAVLTVLDGKGACTCTAFVRSSGRPTANEYNAAGLLIHEPRAADGERLDRYMARIRPDLGDEAYWLAQCEANKVQVKDRMINGVYDRTSWYVEWAFATPDGHARLAPGERPRMRNGYCHIVKEGDMTRRPPEYVALSTINAQASGWEVLARGPDRDAVLLAALGEIDRQYPDRTDIYNDTLRANLRVDGLVTARAVAGRCALGECSHDHDDQEG